MIRFLHYLTRKFRKVHPKIDLSHVRYAFHVGGVAYYTMRDHPDIPAGYLPAKRYQEFLTRHEAMRMGVNREYLEDYIRQMEEVFQPGPTGKASTIDLNKVQRLTYELRTRLELAPIGDDLYEYLSVLYFPLNEDITRYDPTFNQAKIKAWREAEATGDFFSTALRNLPAALTLGWSDTSPGTIENFLTTQNQVLRMLENLSSKPSTKS